jgi:hypothetical protein
MPTPMPLPPITDNLAEIRSHLDEYGCARIGGALTADELREARERLEEQAAAERRLGIGAPPDQWVANLVNKGEIFRRMLLKPITREVMEHVLGENHLLSSFMAHVISKGNTAQGLHRDGGFAPDSTPYPVVANMMWMLVDFTDEIGGTRVIPGSHRAPHRPVRGQHYDTIAATAPAGSAFVFDGRVYHGAGANTTDQPRLGCLSYHSRGWIRQQENFVLSLAPEVQEKCPEELLRLLGFYPLGALGAVRNGRGQGRGAMVHRPTEFLTELH